MRPFLVAPLILLAGPATAADDATLAGHIRAFCHPGLGPAGGVLLTVTVDTTGMVRIAQPASGQDAPTDFARRAMRAVLVPPCGQLLAPGRIATIATFQVRLLPDQ